jgi:hypothetical protein
MTGQVKEDILVRLGELGVRVEEGTVGFDPTLLRPTEFLKKAGIYRFYDLDGRSQSIEVPVAGLAFSFCQVPIIYELTSDDHWIRTTNRNGSSSFHQGNRLDADQSRALFERLGEISRISVGVPEHRLCSC